MSELIKPRDLNHIELLGQRLLDVVLSSVIGSSEAEQAGAHLASIEEHVLVICETLWEIEGESCGRDQKWGEGYRLLWDFPTTLLAIREARRDPLGFPIGEGIGEAWDWPTSTAHHLAKELLDTVARIRAGSRKAVHA